MKKIFLSSLFLFLAFLCFSQEQIEMADELRSSGKIYIVVGVLSVIFVGIVIYLINIDRKISKMEKEK